MNTQDHLKKIVKDKYGEIVHQEKSKNETSCCGSTCGCGEMDYTVFSEDYSSLEGYNPEADLGLGCGLPTEYAGIQPGQVVVDLGSGAGNDCFIARASVGEKGRVIGIDMTPEMIEKARSNAAKLALDNVDFILGDIENMPIEDRSVDVVVSNCVLNLVPDKSRAYQEVFRILKPGGHFSISDVVVIGDLPAEMRKDAELYAGCVGGALEKSEYLGIIETAGFSDLVIHKEREVNLPPDIAEKYSSSEVHKSNLGKIVSITINARR